MKTSVLLFLLTMLNCAHPPSKAELRRAYPSWHKNAMHFDFDEMRLPDDHVLEVSQRWLSEAKDRLQTASAVQLTIQEASQLTGRGIKPPKGTKPYLVRAVRLMDRTHGNTIYVQRDSALRITSSGMGEGPPLAENYPLIVFLRKAPAQVYSTWHLTV